jgi:hypothetical protein
VLSHDWRRILHVNCTERSTSAWTAQQVVEDCETGTPSDVSTHRDRGQPRRVRSSRTFR